MRTPTAILASSFVLAACVSGTGVYVPAPEPTSQPVVMELPPVGVTIVQADDERLQVSTNRPAYLAVFEIVPQRGVSLVYPTTASQRRRATTGSSWLNVTWRAERMGNARYARNDRDDRVERARRGVGESQAAHFVYVIASERPLRNVDRFLDDDDIRDAIGARLFRANDPYETMAELSRHFVPAGQDEDWGEDVYEMDVTRPMNVRVARVYCPDGSVMYVRDEFTDRAWCSYRDGERRRGMPAAPRPDSVVASNGNSLFHRNDPKPQPPRVAVFRVQKPNDVGGMGRPEDRDRLGGEGRKVGGEDGVVLQGDTVKSNGGGKGRGGDDRGNGAKGNNGNHYGWEKGKGNEGKDHGDAGNNGNSGNDHGSAVADSAKNASDRPDGGRGNAKWKIGVPAASPIPGARVKEKPEQPAAQPQDQGKKPDDQAKKPEDQVKKADGDDKKAGVPEGPRKRPVAERDSTGKKDKP